MDEQLAVRAQAALSARPRPDDPRPQSLSPRAARTSRAQPPARSRCNWCSSPFCPSPTTNPMRPCSAPRSFSPSPRPMRAWPKARPPGSVYVVRFDLDPGEAAQAGIRLRRSSSDPNAARAGRNHRRHRHGKGTDLSRSHPLRQDRLVSRFPSAHDRPAQASAGDGRSTSKSSWTRTPIEVFADDGETVLTSLIYPSESSQGLSFFATPMPPGFEPARIRDIQLFPLEQPAGKVNRSQSATKTKSPQSSQEGRGLLTNTNR